VIFSRFASESAEGLVLAHTIRMPGCLIKKGHTLNSKDITELISNEIEHVSGAHLEQDDVTENEAALKIATALCGNGLRVGKPVAGRCNIYANSKGLISINAAVVNAINLYDGTITVATLSPDDDVQINQTVASIKVIPFAVSKKVLHACSMLAKQDTISAVSLKPFIPHLVGLILTKAENIKPSVLDATVEVMNDRVRCYGSEMNFNQRCAHTIEPIIQTLKSALSSESNLILICGATVNVDIGDIIPSAIVLLGGTIEHFGMPVEPGNMLLLARIGPKTIICMPGCSRSPKLNGFDWVLQRILTGQLVNRLDIMQMGVGGLIKDVPYSSRKQKFLTKLNAYKESYSKDKKLSPNVSIIILAAGCSRRMGKQNKLLATLNGKRMLEHVVDAAKASDASRVIVVTGHQAEAIQNALANSKVDFVNNSEYATGIASSIKVGISLLDKQVEGALILLGDMPYVSTKKINEVLSAFDPQSKKDIVVPICGERKGNPVLWAKRYFEEIEILEGDSGAKSLLMTYSENIFRLPSDSSTLIDIDTPSMLISLSQASGDKPEITFCS